MLKLTRRSLIQGSTAAVVGSALSSPLTGMSAVREVFNEFVAEQDQTRKLIVAAVESAMKAGATYADARLTLSQSLVGGVPGSRLGFGVRALVDGYWGFAGSPVWNASEASRLGKHAVGNAKANVLGLPREMIMAPNLPLESGDWIMPVKDDPFEMAPGEIEDYFGGLDRYFAYKDYADSVNGLGGYYRQQRIFGSSDGQFTNQRVYTTEGSVSIEIKKNNEIYGGYLHNFPSSAGLGFEFFRDQPIRQYMDERYEELLEEMNLPFVPVDIGKFPVLINGNGLAVCVKGGIGHATEVDRAMGFGANSIGTSYITDPDTMLGSLKLGSHLWNVSASRSIPGGLGTVKWDDEGVVPKDFDIVRNGVLVDMQTGRESAGWLQPYYERNNIPFLSKGCARALNAINAPSVQCADLTVVPDPLFGKTLAELRSQIDEGVEWGYPTVSFDFQLSTGLMQAVSGWPAWKIKDGKRIAKIAAAGMLFRTSELLENIVHLGDPSTVVAHGGDGSTVRAPAALFKDMTMIDRTRKA